MDEPGEQKSRAPLILAIVNAAFRDQLEVMLQRRGVVPALSGGPGTVFRAPPDLLERAVAVLDTDDDAAMLVQIVNDLYRSPFQSVGAGRVICVVSEQTFEVNRQLGWWLIDGHAAVFAVWFRERERWHETFDRLPRLLETLAVREQADPSDQKEDPHEFSSILQRICREPANAAVWTAFGRRVLESSGDWDTRFRVAAAAAEQAVELMPESPEAHLLLARALSCCGEKERVVEVCQRALPLDPHCAEVYNLLGGALYSLHRDAEAQEAFKHAIEFATDEREAHWARTALDRWTW